MKLKTLICFLFLCFTLTLSIHTISLKNNTNNQFLLNQYNTECTQQNGEIIYHKYPYNPNNKVMFDFFNKKMKKTIKLNYTSTKDIPRSEYWEEYHDGIWYKGYLNYVNHKEIYDSIWQVTFTGKLYKN